jgi:hypothetical protein
MYAVLQGTLQKKEDELSALRQGAEAEAAVAKSAVEAAAARAAEAESMMDQYRAAAEDAEADLADAREDHEKILQVEQGRWAPLLCPCRGGLRRSACHTSPLLFPVLLISVCMRNIQGVLHHMPCVLQVCSAGLHVSRWPATLLHAPHQHVDEKHTGGPSQPQPVWSSYTMFLAGMQRPRSERKLPRPALMSWISSLQICNGSSLPSEIDLPQPLA